MLARLGMALLACCLPGLALTESVEFPWNTFPRHLWERELVWMKNIGVRHVSLPPASDPALLSDVIGIIRRLGLEADLEGPVPAALESLSTRHGGPLSDPVADVRRISVLQPGALRQSREILLSGAAGILWTNVEDTLGPAGYVRGAVSFAGQERAATSTLRRNTQVSRYWSSILPTLQEIPGAGTRLPTEMISVKQYVTPNGVSVISIVNSGATSWTGDIKATYPALHRVIVLPNITVEANDTSWLPVGIPLTGSPLCRDCNGFAPPDHLVYATAEITAMEYENGILALEFASPGTAEVILQLSREPSGPLVAGGKPAQLDWDDKTLRARLFIPGNTARPHHVRIGLAIEPPDATAFFDSARVLLIGETNHLKAQFSSEAVAQRSRLRILPAFPATSTAGHHDLESLYAVSVPSTAVHGDHAELALEADGARLSHAQPQLLHAATVRFPDAVRVRLAADSTLALYPAVVPFNQRAGRDFTVTLRNNAPEIRTFQVSVVAAGLEFSPAQNMTVGASDSRDLVFRVFPSPARMPGLYGGEVRVTGAASASEPLRFLAVPQGGSVAWTSDGFSLLESIRTRASFMPGRWLEYLDKDKGSDALPPGGVPFKGQPPSSVSEVDALGLPKR